MIEYDKAFQHTINRIVTEGWDRPDRTGVGAKSVFDVNFNVNLSRTDHRYTLPALTLRKVFPRSAWYELFWMLRGSMDARELQEKRIGIWDGNTSREFLDNRGLYHIREGFIGSSGYGPLFRDFDGVDQLKELLKGLLTNPNSRRHIISLWSPSQLDNMALPCCHHLYNFMVTGEYLHLKFTMRSNDLILAGCQNLMFATFFLSWVASILGFKVGSVAQSITDCHIYDNLVPVAYDLLLHRDPIDHVASFEMPKSPYCLKSVRSIDECLEKELEFMWNDKSWDTIKSSLDYQSNPAIPKEKLVMAV